MRLFFLVFLLIFLSIIVLGQDNSNFFVKNKGQWEASVLAKAELPSGALFLQDNALVFHFIDQQKLASTHDSLLQFQEIDAHAFRWEFLKSKTKKIVYSDPLQGRVNFLNTKNPVSNLSKFKKATYQEIYSGIDYQLYGYGDGLKYDWIVRPKGNPKDIKMELFGAKDVSIKDGRLFITTSVNHVLEESPYAYQIIDNRKVEVKCDFVWHKNKLSFSFPEGYNKKQELIIDPIMVFSSFSGSTANNFGFTATYDDYGFLYAGGVAFNIGYPTTFGAYQLNYSGGVSGTDIVLTKYDTTGSFLVYSTYLGGSGDEVPHSLIVNNDELFMMGTSGSNDFPVTPNCFDSTFNSGPPLAQGGVSINYTNGCDIVVCRLSADGSDLLASTFLGGTGNDGFNTANGLRFNYADQMRGEIDIDSQGNCFIASTTLSTDFPIVNSLVQPINNGEQDGLIVKMDLDLTQIEWSSYWGGSSDDAIYSLAFDKQDNIYVSGGTASDNLLTTAGAYKTNYQGGSVDAFITQFSNDGSQVLNSTFFGTPEYDQSYFIELDNQDQVYVFGQTLDDTDILIQNAAFFQPQSGQFVSKFSGDLSTLSFSTLFGSGRSEIDIVPTAFLVDACNRVYCSGWGGTTNSFANGGPGGHTGGLITTADAFSTTTDSSDFYIIIFEDDANTLSYASFFGGNQAAEHVDGGTSRFDKKGVIYQSVCAGCGGSSDFPTTDGAFSAVNNSSCNNAVFKFDPQFPITVASFNAPDFSCQNTVNFENTSQGNNNTYDWDFGDGNSSQEVNPSHEFLTEGDFVVTLYSIDPISCNLIDSISKTITIRNNKYFQQDTLTLCYGDSVELNVSPLEDYTYYWTPSTYLQSPQDVSTYANPEETITYYAVGIRNQCSDTLEQRIVVNKVELNFVSDFQICGDTVSLSAASDPNSDIVWSLDPSFDDVIGQNAITTSQIGDYYVRATLGDCASVGIARVDITPECCSKENLQIPNAFSANGDGINDYFLIKDSKGIVQDFELQIFNRWGQKTFYSKDKTQKWDGFFKGVLQPSSVFDYHLSVGCIEEKGAFFIKGNITLVR